MTIAKGFLTIILSGFGFAVAGTLIGWSLAVAAPGYYRAVFRGGRDPGFDPVAVGVGLGLSQGLICGVIVGAVVVLAVAWYNSRRRTIDMEYSSRPPRFRSQGEPPSEEYGFQSRRND